MSHRTSSIVFATLALICLVVVSAFLSTAVQAQSIQIDGGEDKCITCHEDLYFLHDAGNWFCIRESPMRCVDCHGGDSEAITQEAAHLNRAAHPVINEDVSKCQECHPEQCDERVKLFDQTAGISQARVAVPYTPAYSSKDNVGVNPDLSEQKEPDGLLSFWEIILLTVIVGLALIIYMAYHKFHKKTN
jgi:hypothetical protein